MASPFKQTTTNDPLYCLLNAETEQGRDELTSRWKDNKLEELNFIGIVGALLAGVLTSTGSWPAILPNGTRSPWTVRACWYCGLIFALASVLTAAQQSIRLHRLSCHPKPEACIRRLLKGPKSRRTGKVQPRRLQVYAWQLSAIMLSMSVLTLLAGLFILVWSSTLSKREQLYADWWNGEAKLAVTFSIVALAVGIIFAVQEYTLFSWYGDDDRDQQEDS